MKTGAISGAEYRKHENWCHQWSRIPKTWKLVPSVEQSTENMKTGAIAEQSTENMKTGAISHDQVDRLFV